MAGAADEETNVNRFDRREDKLAVEEPNPETAAGPWPVDLVPDAFVSAPPPWLPEGELAAGPFALGDSVRLVRLPENLASLPRRARKRFGAIVGQLFEVVALTIPGQLAIARWVEIDGESGMQTLYVPVDCVDRVDFAAPRPSDAARAAAAGTFASDEDLFEPCDELEGFKTGDCARLVRLPPDIRELSREERREYQAMIGECFEILTFWRAENEVHLARSCESDSGLPGFEVVIMPLDCIEHAEWDPEPEEELAGPSVN
jgi:hypothetical protein